MTQSLISNLLKLPKLVQPGSMIPGASPPSTLVGGADSVPIELGFMGIAASMPVGVDIVFLIDNSGGMVSSDPDKKRFRAVRDLITMFNVTYHELVSAVSGNAIRDARLASVRDAIVVTIVDLQADNDELVVANNRAIEIVQLDGS